MYKNFTYFSDTSCTQGSHGSRKVLKMDRGAEKVLNLASLFLKNQVSDLIIFAV